VRPDLQPIAAGNRVGKGKPFAASCSRVLLIERQRHQMFVASREPIVAMACR
jgi:hypothetical protein